MYFVIVLNCKVKISFGNSCRFFFLFEEIFDILE